MISRNLKCRRPQWRAHRCRPSQPARSSQQPRTHTYRTSSRAARRVGKDRAQDHAHTRRLSQTRPHDRHAPTAARSAHAGKQRARLQCYRFTPQERSRRFRNARPMFLTAASAARARAHLSSKDWVSCEQRRESTQQGGACGETHLRWTCRCACGERHVVLEHRQHAQHTCSSSMWTHCCILAFSLPNASAPSAGRTHQVSRMTSMGRTSGLG